MTIYYIAGPMRGHEQFNFPAFDAARDKLLAMGHEVISPADMDRDLGFDEHTDSIEDMCLSDAATRDLMAVISDAEALAVLPGWRNSRGARAEVAVAIWMDIPVVDVDTLEQVEEDILEEALRITTGDRNNSCGPPTQDFDRTAKMWSAIFGVEVKPKQVAMAMIALKLSRATWSDSRDHWVDMAGYARCGWLCVESEDSS